MKRGYHKPFRKKNPHLSEHLGSISYVYPLKPAAGNPPREIGYIIERKGNGKYSNYFSKFLNKKDLVFCKFRQLQRLLQQHNIFKINPYPLANLSKKESIYLDDKGRIFVGQKVRQHGKHSPQKEVRRAQTIGELPSDWGI